MLSAVRTRIPSFWLLQAGAWTLTYALLLLAAYPHLSERDILRYNTVGCVVLFCATLAVRPLCQLATARDYAELHTPTGTFLVRETMQALQQRLNPDRFVRIHRSRIVGWDQIAELTRQDNGEYRVKLLDGSEHRASRTYTPTLENW